MMKQLIVCLLLVPSILFSQEKWDGTWLTKIDGLEIYIAIEEANQAVYLTIPAQGIIDTKADNAEFDGDRMDFFIRKFGASFYGNLENEKIKGEWDQGGRKSPMIFKRFEGKLSFDRPQEPVEPYPYISEDIKFTNKKDNIHLAATVTKPEGNGPFPAIVLISGSGPQNRNSAVFQHQPFLVLADYYTRRGYAVLRYDERGIGQSGGKFMGATSEDFSYDVEAAFQYLQQRDDIDAKKVGLMGHSEGGLIAPMVAARNKEVAFTVLVAGPGIPPKDIMKYQISRSYDKLKLSSDGSKKKDVFVNEFFDILAQNKPNDQIIDEFQATVKDFYLSLNKEDQMKFGGSQQEFYFSMAPSFLAPWMRYFLQYDPAKKLKKVKSPVLAVNGKKDRQVTAKENLKGIKKALKAGGNKNFKIKKFRKLNHLFQKCKTGEGSEYATIEETFNPKAMKYIGDWMDKIVR